ncbi:MAG: aminoglycoside phosphotransferase family protein [Candidatus Obscuribacterales bacterium]|nr:aminoglycoside phosphotransferase family protein [Candidatus Obscuribacterales bacterium]
MNQRILSSKIDSFLTLHGLQNCKVTMLRGGKNNQVYRVDSASSSQVLKAYFQHTEDSRPRCRTEFSFSSFLWGNGIRCIPEPIACDTNAGLALYRNVEGRALTAGDVNDSAVEQALRFYNMINRCRDHAEAATLGEASEACFSVSQHVACVETRIERLVSRVDESDCDRRLLDFVSLHLLPAWEDTKTRIDQACSRRNLDPGAILPRTARRLSPSDFGFHNALRLPSGELCFLDFEYSGWDDPAKLVCDFFLQPQLPVPSKPYFKRVLNFIEADLDEDRQIGHRVEVLADLYRVKWCCILLNVFLPAGQSRRTFAAGAADEPSTRDEECSPDSFTTQEQLDKALSYLETRQLCKHESMSLFCTEDEKWPIWTS